MTKTASIFKYLCGDYLDIYFLAVAIDCIHSYRLLKSLATKLIRFQCTIKYYFNSFQ